MTYSRTQGQHQIVTPYLASLLEKGKELPTLATLTGRGKVKPLATPLHQWSRGTLRVAALGAINQTGLLGKVTDRTAVWISPLLSPLAEKAVPPGLALLNWTIQWGLNANPMRTRKRIRFLMNQEEPMTLLKLHKIAMQTLTESPETSSVDLSGTLAVRQTLGMEPR